MSEKNLDTILLVDDENSLLTLMTRVLKNEGISYDNGYNIVTASTGSIGLELFHQYIPKLIITDRDMEGPNSGVELIKKIREFDSYVPIAITTSHFQPEDIEQYHDAGATKLIKKPYRSRNIIDFVNQYLNQSTQPHTNASFGRQLELITRSDNFQEYSRKK